MKYAVLSDIHGNATALKAVLEDVKNKGIVDFIIAGDYCLSGPYPDECISIIRNLKYANIIRGNEEQSLTPAIMWRKSSARLPRRQSFFGVTGMSQQL